VVAYLLEIPPLIAIVLPALVSIALWSLAPTVAVPMRELALPFLYGTSLSVTFSYWQELDGVLSIHMLAGYFLLCVLLPRADRPTWAQAYGLSFASLLAADLWCAIQHDIAQFGYLRPEFFRGVGGAGFCDDLFILPIATAMTLLALGFVELQVARRPSSQ
jgi:hypothetical protein